MPPKKKIPEIKKWSKQVTEKSNALDLEARVFKLSPKKGKASNHNADK